MISSSVSVLSSCAGLSVFSGGGTSFFPLLPTQVSHRNTIPASVLMEFSFMQLRCAGSEHRKHNTSPTDLFACM